MITITHGIGNSTTCSDITYHILEQLLADVTLQTLLNFDPAQTEARVNGVTVSMHSPIPPNARIDLLRKAGSKSQEFMNHDQQLRPLAVASNTLRLIKLHAAAALRPIYKAYEDSEELLSIKHKEAQLKLLKKTEFFTEQVHSVINDIITKSSRNIPLTVPSLVKAQLEELHQEFENNCLPLKQKLILAETQTNAWTIAVEADLQMCLVLGDQRIITARALQSDPLQPWVFASTITAPPKNKK